MRIGCLFLIAFCCSTVVLTAAQGTPAKLNAVEAEKWRADLRFMATEMPRLHRNLFHQMTREQFDAAVKQLDERIPSLARNQVIVEMERILAMVGDGHTNISPMRDPKIGFRALPIKLYFFKDGLFIRAATREHADLVGARVVKIGDSTADEAFKAVTELIGRDNEMDAKFFAPHLLVMPEVLNALGLIESLESAAFTVELNGKQNAVRLAPSGPAEMMPSDTDVSWEAKPDWVDAGGGESDKRPLWLRDPRNKFWYEYLTDSKTVYVQYNQVGNKDEETIEAFAGRLFAFVDANPVDRLVLDLRLNRGGNGGLNKPLLLGLIRSKIDLKGKLFVLIGRSTFSAAQFLVDDLEKYTEAIFVGEPSGGKVNSYGDSRKITLPNSGITVRVSSLWWQGDERDKRQWRAPDIAAELTFADYRAGIDPALNAALNYKPKPSLNDILHAALIANESNAPGAALRKWNSDPANAYIDTEPILIGLGYELLSAKQTNQAIEVFKLAAQNSPQSANAFDSLGEAYLAAGNAELAKLNYEKALALEPSLDSAIEALKKLR